MTGIDTVQKSGRDLLADQSAALRTAGAQRVVVVDLDMPFGSMVSFIFKWTLASIPALLAIGAIAFFLMAALASFGRG
jgi:hypothetical protein